MAPLAILQFVNHPISIIDRSTPGAYQNVGVHDEIALHAALGESKYVPPFATDVADHAFKKVEN
jgi:hypothetical protein